MKKSALVAMVMFVGSFAHAQLDANCERFVRQAANQQAMINAAIAEGSLTAAEAEFFAGSSKEMAQNAVRTCVGIEEVRIEKTFRGKMGLISQAEIEKRLVAVVEEATDLYNSLTK